MLLRRHVQRSQARFFSTRRALSTAVLSALALAANPALAVLQSPDFGEMSLEELANLKITSVSKKSESLAQAPASIFVITNEDLRRSGVTTLPEALRLAPNMQVARNDARNYAVTARGFNSVFENKLLVLIDGRIVYSPLFSGVYWDAQTVVLEDIERIEVISGPGATMWGANAVNGVINVITKSAADTQGGLVSAGVSSMEKKGVVRYGGKMANGGHYRVYSKYADNENTKRANGTETATGMHRQLVGFRTDWTRAGDRITVQGEAYDGNLHQAGTADIGIRGANLIGRLNRTLENGADLNLQAYWDYTYRNQPNAFIEDLHTVDLQLQTTQRLSPRHELIWGGGYRMAMDRVQNGPVFAFLPGDLDMYWGNVFVQDELALTDSLRLTTGLKLDKNNYTGLEILPTLRLSWKLADNKMLWSSASRSVRTPSRIDRDFFAPTRPTVVNGVERFNFNGGPDFISEVANVLEIGYRAQPLTNVTFSATAFYSHFERLRTLEPNPAGFGSVFANGASGQSKGIEMWGSWQALPSWRLSGGLVTQRVATMLYPGSKDATGTTGFATSDPSNYWTVRSSWDIAPGHELDAIVRHVGALGTPAVPAYTSMDLRYGWKLRRDVELSVVGQNLLQSSHAEFGAAPGRSEYDRNVFVKVLWRL